MARHLHAAAVDHQRGTFGHAAVHIGLHLLEVRLGHQRAHVVAVVGARADLHLGDLGLQARNHGVTHFVAHGHQQGDGHAALAARTVGGAHQGAHGVVHIGVGHEHGVVLGAAQGLHALAVLAAFAVDVFGNGGGADKAHGLDAGVLQQRVHGQLVAVDHVQHARRKACFQRQLGDEQGAGRIALGGLEHEGVAAGHGHGPHPQRHHGREVEGRDACGDPQGLELAPAVDAGAHVAAVLALEQLGRVAGVFHVLDAALQLAVGIGQHLAVLGGDHRSDLVGVFFEQHFELAHHAGALQRRCVAPGREGGFGRGNGGFHRGLARQGHAGGRLAGGGVEHRLRAFGVGDELAVDQMADGLGHVVIVLHGLGVKWASSAYPTSASSYQN